jgi:wyosine [tRNA(Phe)-imidazoG37] synthetase (radical SAM superfamily)
MATFLFNEIVFGPVSSRRLGVSLGINLLPVDSKVCSFDCIYCECGWTPHGKQQIGNMPSRIQVKEKLEAKLLQMQQDNLLPDVITFAGNGEPTLHQEFDAIIDDTIQLRNQYAPAARIAVLSNASVLHRKSVFNSLLKVDDNIQKLDSAFDETVRLLDKPRGRFDLQKVIEQLCDFKGKVIIQTMFVRGSWQGKLIDNSTDHEVSAWLEVIRKIDPGQVMIYTIARDTPINTLEKISLQELEYIADRVREAGYDVQVSG